VSESLPQLSPQLMARLVPSEARAELLEVLREAALLLPVAGAVVKACDAAGPKGVEPAKTAGRIVSAFGRMAWQVRRLPIGQPLRTRLVQLLDYHEELIGQAMIAAYSDPSERQALARGAGGLGEPSVELEHLAVRLRSALGPVGRLAERQETRG
jgi:hypothetical protein